MRSSRRMTKLAAVMLFLCIGLVPIAAHADDYTFTDVAGSAGVEDRDHERWGGAWRSEEHTSELQSH